MLQSLRDVLAGIVPEKQEEVKAFRAQHGKTKVGEVTVDMVSLRLKVWEINVYMVHLRPTV